MLKSKSLVLSRETLRSLSNDEKQLVQGGGGKPTYGFACNTGSGKTFSNVNTHPVECC